jgi:hypothetical protein
LHPSRHPQSGLSEQLAVFGCGAFAAASEQRHLQIRPLAGEIAVSGEGGGGLTATGLFCGFCGAQSGPTAKFCGEYGTRLTQATQSAEYKQVTVLFADVVHSMDIAAKVGPERLREIMAELVERCAAVVKRYGGTVDKFTGDGIMAVFGAPVATEDHAVRACPPCRCTHHQCERQW